MDGQGDAFVAGYTGSAGFPTVNAYQSAFGSSTYDAFLTKVNPSGSGLIYSTYFGSGNTVKAAGVAVERTATPSWAARASPSRPPPAPTSPAERAASPRSSPRRGRP